MSVVQLSDELKKLNLHKYIKISNINHTDIFSSTLYYFDTKWYYVGTFNIEKFQSIVLHCLQNISHYENIINFNDLENILNDFVDNDFENNLDENKKLIGFDNGVYDLSLNIFRKMEPEDNIMLSVGYNYNECNPDNDFMMFLNKTLPDVATQEYVLKLFSSIPKNDIALQTDYNYTNYKSDSEVMAFLNKILSDVNTQ